MPLMIIVFASINARKGTVLALHSLNSFAWHVQSYLCNALIPNRVLENALHHYHVTLIMLLDRKNHAMLCTSVMLSFA